MRTIPFPKPYRGDVTVLIGSDQSQLVLLQQFKVGTHGEPVAVKDKLGLILLGGKGIIINIYNVISYPMIQSEIG